MKYADENKLTYIEATQKLNRMELVNYEQRMSILQQQFKNTNNPLIQQEIEKLVFQGQVSRLQGLLFEIDSRLIVLANGQQMTIEDFLYDTYESNYYQTGFNIAVGTGIGATFTKLNDRAIRQAITFPWSGDQFSQRIWDNRNKLVSTMRQTIINGFIRGSSVQKMSRELSKVMNSAYKNSLRLIRTETAHVIGEATAEGYNEYGIEQYQYIATLDKRTSSICRGLDSKVFDLKDKQVGVNYPPMHPNCRSAVAAYFDRDYTVRRARRNDGQNEIIPNMSYSQWEKKYVK